MKEAEVEMPFLDAELAAASGRRVERNKTEEAILKLRKRLAKVIRENVSFPDEIQGKKLELVPGFSSKADWVDNGTEFYRELSTTTLMCRPVKQGKQINIVLFSDIYPSGNQADTDNPKSRQANFRVFVERLDYYFSLGRGGVARIHWLEGTESQKRVPEDMNINRIRALGEVMDLIESPKTKFVATGYSLGG